MKKHCSKCGSLSSSECSAFVVYVPSYIGDTIKEYWRRREWRGSSRTNRKRQTMCHKNRCSGNVASRALLRLPTFYRDWESRRRKRKSIYDASNCMERRPRSRKKQRTSIRISNGICGNG